MLDDLNVDVDALLAHVDEYQRVRGWRARRVYLTPSERRALLVSTHMTGMFMPSSGEFMYDGAALRVVTQAVAARIREWDMQP